MNKSNEEQLDSLIKTMSTEDKQATKTVLEKHLERLKFVDPLATKVQYPELLMPKFSICVDPKLPKPVTGLHYYWNGKLDTDEQRNNAEEFIRVVLNNVDSHGGARSAQYFKGNYPVSIATQAFRHSVYEAGYNYVGLFPVYGVCIWGCEDSEGLLIRESRALMSLIKFTVDILAENNFYKIEEVMYHLNDFIAFLTNKRILSGNLYVDSVLHNDHRGKWHSIKFVGIERFGMCSKLRTLFPSGSVEMAEICWAPESRGPRIGVGIQPCLKYLYDIYEVDSWSNKQFMVELN